MIKLLENIVEVVLILNNDIRVIEVIHLINTLGKH